MCIIATKYEGVDLPKEEHLRNCESKNKDGIGIAYLKSGSTEIKIKKDFKNIDEFVKWFYDNIKKEDICIVHFRLATHGLKDEGNRHPFPITKNKELLRQTELICNMAVAHNGVISNYGHHKKFSDTQKFILDILSDDTIKTNLRNPAVRKLIDNFLGGDRLAILLKDKSMFCWGEWVQEGDVFYSNDGYKEKKYEFSYLQNWKNDWRDDVSYFEICDNCRKEKHTQMVHIGEECFLLCKSCRKQARKGKLAIAKAGTSLSMESQCESCLEWVDDKDLVNYYGGRLCKKCVQDICRNELGHIDSSEEGIR